jgi:Zn/Cd-binding protein ZinT
MIVFARNGGKSTLQFEKNTKQILMAKNGERNVNSINLRWRIGGVDAHLIKRVHIISANI